MSGWFSTNIEQTGRFPLFCFFVAFVAGFGFIRLSVRMIRANVRWWPGNVTPGTACAPHGVRRRVHAGRRRHRHRRPGRVAGLAGRRGRPVRLGRRARAGRVRADPAPEGRVLEQPWAAVGGSGVRGGWASPCCCCSASSRRSCPPRATTASPAEAIIGLTISVLFTFGLVAISLLKGKIWTGLFGLFLPLLIVGAIRLARPGSPWARWRYQNKPHKRARAARRERRWRQPVVRFRVRLEDFVSGLQVRPEPKPLSPPEKSKSK